jgi:hypothetical protein
MTTASYFPGFDYPSSDLLRFLTASDFFAIILNNGDIVYFSPEDEMLFKKWLIDNNVVDMRKEEGWIIT